LEKALRQL